MTETQKRVMAEVERNGYAVVHMSHRRSNPSKKLRGNSKTGMGLGKLGLRTFWTGAHMGVAKTEKGAEAACYLANYRNRISEWNKAIDGGDSEWRVKFLLGRA